MAATRNQYLRPLTIELSDASFLVLLPTPSWAWPQEFIAADVSLLPPEEIAAAWHQEIHDRLDQYDRGEVKAIPADVVFAELTTRLASRKK